jgi:hypothetical protein
MVQMMTVVFVSSFEAYSCGYSPGMISLQKFHPVPILISQSAGTKIRGKDKRNYWKWRKEAE